MVPYHATKAWGQVPCEDVTIRIPIPEAWVYQFRSEKLDVSLGKVVIIRFNFENSIPQNAFSIKIDNTFSFFKFLVPK